MSLTQIEKDFLDTYNLYDEYVYDVNYKTSIEVVYPSTSKLTKDQENYIILRISELYPNKKVEVTNRILTIDDKSIYLNSINPILSSAVYANPLNSELKTFSVDVDFRAYNITNKKTFIKFGILSSVVYNENFLKNNSKLVSYDTNSCWYHVYDFQPIDFHEVQFDYHLIQPKFNFRQIFTEELTDSEKLNIMKELSLLYES